MTCVVVGYTHNLKFICSVFGGQRAVADTFECRSPYSCHRGAYMLISDRLSAICVGQS